VPTPSGLARLSDPAQPVASKPIEPTTHVGAPWSPTGEKGSRS
jgi:hypothetical protein